MTRLLRLAAVVLLVLPVAAVAPEAAPVSAESQAAALWAERTSDTLVVVRSKDGRPAIETFPARSERAVQAVLESDGRGAFVEWDAPAAVTADTYDFLLWNLTDTGARSVWSSLTGSPVVAVLDTGVNAHVELGSRLLAGYNSIDDSSVVTDGHGHGTHIAGTIAATANNDLGIAGVAPHASILPVKVLSDTGSGFLSDVAEGLIWATDNGATVANLSLGGESDSVALQLAVQYATTNGVVVVAAAGNDGPDNAVYYPASYADVIAVAATDSERDTPSWSNRGSWLDVSAPGVSIPSLAGTTQYTSMSGTSMAAPHVAAQAAILRSAYPTASVSQVRSWILSTVDDIGAPGFDSVTGNGTINIPASLAAADAEITPTTTTTTSPTTTTTTLPPTTTTTTTLPPTTTPPPLVAPSSATASVSGLDVAVSWEASTSPGVAGYRVTRNGALVGIVSTTRLADRNAALARGSYIYAVTPVDGYGTPGDARTASINVAPPRTPRITRLSVSRRTLRITLSPVATNQKVLVYIDGTLRATLTARSGPSPVVSLRTTRGYRSVSVRVSSPKGTSARSSARRVWVS